MTGGMRIIRALVGGERDLDILASYRDVRCHAPVETINAALNGNDRPEHIFAFTQSLDLYDFYQSKRLECDRNLEAMLDVLAAEQEHDPGQLPKARIRTKQVGTLSFDVRAALFGVFGLDLTQIHGMGPSLSLKPVGECGTDLRAWPGAKRFTPRICLAPGNRISGGKILSSRTRRSSSRATALLRLAAVTIGCSDTASGAFYRRLAARADKAEAVTASARKIAVLVYNTLRHGMTYKNPGASHYEERYRNRVLGNLKRRAKSLGYDLQELPTEVDMAVS
jgi:transposase